MFFFAAGGLLSKSLFDRIDKMILKLFSLSLLIRLISRLHIVGGSICFWAALIGMLNWLLLLLLIILLLILLTGHFFFVSHFESPLLMNS
jgi:hypothetical protein